MEPFAYVSTPSLPPSLPSPSFLEFYFFVFFLQFTDHLFVLIVGMSYSVIAPIITPFVLFYFGFGYVVWMYQIMCVYIPVYSCGGLMWPKVFNR